MCVCYNVCEFALTCLLHLNFLRQRTLNSLARKFLSCHNRVNSRTQRRPLLRQTNLSLKPRRPMRVTGTSTQAVSVFVCFKFACYNFVCATTWLRYQNKEQKKYIAFVCWLYRCTYDACNEEPVNDTKSLQYPGNTEFRILLWNAANQQTNEAVAANDQRAERRTSQARAKNITAR